MIKWAFKILLLMTVMFFAVTTLFVVLYKYVPVHYTPLMVIRYAEGDKNFKLHKDWVDFKEINTNIKKKIIRAEDTKFYEHDGFDFEAIEKAIVYNKKVKNKPKRGASTISQQTAKNTFLWPSRSWVRKGLEVYFTVLIEAIWTKDRILEVYLNIIELGDGVFGVEAASKKFFKKSAAKINAHEASLMAAVLPNPRKLKINKPSAYVLKRQRILLGRRSSPPKAVVAIVEEAPKEIQKIEAELIETPAMDKELKRELEELKDMFEEDTI